MYFELFESIVNDNYSKEELESIETALEKKILNQNNNNEMTQN